MSKKIILTPNAPTPIGPYSQGIECSGKIIYTAGQVPIDPKTGEFVPGDIQTQTRRALLNVQAILQAGGATLADVVKTTVFIKDMNEFAAMNNVYAEFFPSSPPARSTVEVARLPKDARVEVEAIAVIQ